MLHLSFCIPRPTEVRPSHSSLISRACVGRLLQMAASVFVQWRWQYQFILCLFYHRFRSVYGSVALQCRGNIPNSQKIIVLYRLHACIVHYCQLVDGGVECFSNPRSKRHSHIWLSYVVLREGDSLKGWCNFINFDFAFNILYNNDNLLKIVHACQPSA